MQQAVQKPRQLLFFARRHRAEKRICTGLPVFHRLQGSRLPLLGQGYINIALVLYIFVSQDQPGLFHAIQLLTQRGRAPIRQFDQLPLGKGTVQIQQNQQPPLPAVFFPRLHQIRALHQHTQQPQIEFAIHKTTSKIVRVLANASIA